MSNQDLMHEKLDHQSQLLEKTRVLVVEDQEDMLEMMVTFLRNMGITKVVAVDDGDKALRYIANSLGRIDFVICDWNIPKQSGCDILRELRLLRPDIPFLMVTGRKDIDSVFVAQKLGVSSYLTKPFSGKEFERRLRLLIKKVPIREGVQPDEYA